MHGCGPGLRTATRAFACSRARPRPPKRREMDARAALLESKSREEVFFAAGVGVVQTLRVDEARDDDSAEVA